jgi:para-aminobenzoate synthetase
MARLLSKKQQKKQLRKHFYKASLRQLFTLCLLGLWGHGGQTWQYLFGAGVSVAIAFSETRNPKQKMGLQRFINPSTTTTPFRRLGPSKLFLPDNAQGESPSNQRGRDKVAIDRNASGIQGDCSIDQDDNCEPARKFNVTLLLIDHYDSFTYNLFDMLAQLTLQPPVVLAKDVYEMWPTPSNGLNGTNDPSLSWFQSLDGIILSPGPGNPYDQPDFSKQAITCNPNLPILGVCLGHQLMATTYGATVDTAPIPIHGQVYSIHQLSDNDTSVSQNSSSPSFPSIFDQLPDSWNAMRYHSLAIQPDSISPTDLKVTATTLEIQGENQEAIIQGIAHTKYPHYGVQFHPESVGTEHGKQLLQNFCQLCYNLKLGRQERQKESENSQSESIRQSFLEANGTNGSTTSYDNVSSAESSLPQSRASSSSSRFEVIIFKVPPSVIPSSLLTPEVVFESFYAEEPFSMWLDSSRSASPSFQNGEDSTSTTGSVGTLSILASPTRIDDSGRLVEYYVSSNTTDKDDGHDILTWLQKQLGQPTKTVRIVREFAEGGANVAASSSTVVWEHDFVSNNDLYERKNMDGILPFDYRGGFLGYLGYSVRRDTGRYLQEVEYAMKTPSPPMTTAKSATGARGEKEKVKKNGLPSTPSAAFFLAEQSMVYHHPTQAWYLVGLVDRDDDVDTVDLENSLGEAKVLNWMKETSNRMKGLDTQLRTSPKTKGFLSEDCKRVPFVTGRTPETSKKTNGGDKKYVHHSRAALTSFTPNRSETTYKRNIAECKEHIRLGESYELCLTNQLEATIGYSSLQALGGPVGMYKVLRQRNPAPYSAFFNWNIAGVTPNGQDLTAQNCAKENDPLLLSVSSPMAICCSSPERFISVQKRRQSRRQGTVSQQSIDTEEVVVLQAEAKPIKGTIARIMPQKNQPRTDHEQEIDAQMAQKLKESIKDRAENYMIVDLLRNDLSRVCAIGSVHVAKLMAIESYTTVHQMVSTIRGTLSTLLGEGNNNESKISTQGDKTAFDLLKACFPGGSMTGAPKIRTMELLEEMEEYIDRGPYSGSLGYVSVNGCMDMNIIIRSAVLSPIRHFNEERNDQFAGELEKLYKISVGAGGAITSLSTCDDEYAEMILKTSAVVQAVQDWARGDSSEDEPSVVIVGEEMAPVQTQQQQQP